MSLLFGLRRLASSPLRSRVLCSALPLSVRPHFSSLPSVLSLSFSAPRPFTSASSPTPASSPASSPAPRSPNVSSSPIDPTEASWFHRLMERVPRLKSMMIFSGVFLAGLLVVRIGTDTVVFFSKLNILNVAESAYMAGLVSGVVLVLVGIGGLRAWQIRPEVVQSIAMKKVLSDVRIKHILGNDVKTAAFKAYSFVPGHIRWSAQDRAQARLAIELHRASNEYSDLKVTADQEKAKHSTLKKLFNERFLLWYKPKSLQLFFQLNSPDNSAHAMVSAEVEKTFRGEHVWNVLSVDFIETGDRIVIEGDPDIVLYRGVVKLR